MQIIKGFENIPPSYKDKLYVALGNFDGVHKGHQEVIKNTINLAANLNGVSAAMVFEPHPAKVINPKSDIVLLSDITMKAKIFESLGIEVLVVENFDEYFASISPDDFVNKYLKEKLNVKGIVTGFDYTFGKKAEGTTEHLKKWGEQNGVKVLVCPPVKAQGRVVSSSAIRKLITAGKVEEASYLLNYYFYRQGKVVSGDGRGKKLGYPTANIKLSPDIILPAEGVYYTIIERQGQLFPSATNVGKRPTFSSNNLTVETNILDFNENIYGEELIVYFIQRIREEKAFNTTEKLIEQMSEDIKQTRKLAANPLNNLLPKKKLNEIIS